MKTKKGLTRQTWQVLTFIAIILCSFSLSACDEGDENGLLTGKWILKKGDYASTSPLSDEIIKATYRYENSTTSYYYCIFNEDGIYRHGRAGYMEPEGIAVYAYNKNKKILIIGDKLYHVIQVDLYNLVLERINEKDPNFYSIETYVRE